MLLHWEPIGHKVRRLNPGGDFDNDEPYVGVLTIVYTHEMERAYVSGAHFDTDKFDSDVWDAIAAGCKAQGVKVIEYKHHGKIVVVDLENDAKFCGYRKL